MTLNEFDKRIEWADTLRKLAKTCDEKADIFEELCYSIAGIYHVERGSGFPGWAIIGIGGYFHTPRQAMEALERENGK
jgi:hypothetical protein